MRTSVIAVAALVLGLLAPLPPAAGAGAEAGWFVLRHPQSGDCRTARLISISGQLASGSGQIAGGPFPSEAEAEAHRARLVERGTCRPDEPPAPAGGAPHHRP